MATELKKFYIGSSYYLDMSEYLKATAAADTYVTKTGLTTTLGDYVTTASQATTLAGYVKTTALETTLADYATTAAMNEAIAGITHMSISVVDELPTTGQANVIYLVPSTTSKTQNVKDEYLWINNAWELIGTSATDLNNYVTTASLNTTLDAYVKGTELTTTLESYVTSDELTTTLADYAKTTEITTAYEAADATTLASAKTYADTKLTKLEMTQTQFDGLSAKDNNTIYIITA